MVAANQYDILVVDTMISESIKVIRNFESSSNIIAMIGTLVQEFRDIPRMSKVT